MYCNCKPVGERVEMIRESYPDPKQDKMIYKWLCCACGYTQEYDAETDKLIKTAN